ncbi:MAG: translation initiation factor IF-3 [Gammaproteobacteria bacterium TMED119]|nr:MAG: translation initiation factor IF-3 [Gammaproteobacteria bacterium TMED119]RCL46288.1 MAG: translation initiation factor IF-3 [Candidatus Thioglobus sp.]
MSASKDVRLNEEIFDPEVRLIDATGDNVGVVKIEEALRMAGEADLDLVEISPNAQPPVCRVMDYGKFKFEQSKRAHLAKKKQKQIQVKEIKFRPGTEEGDYQVKLRKLIEFLEDGDKTKITIRYRGREMQHQQLGAQLLNRLEADLEDYGDVEQRPKMEGRQLVMVLAPTKKKK